MCSKTAIVKIVVVCMFAVFELVGRDIFICDCIHGRCVRVLVTTYIFKKHECFGLHTSAVCVDVNDLKAMRCVCVCVCA